ncbi:MAG: hypothetical protein NTZ97_01100, partial [Candidatus Moranbacteria bacterium]|nr:hypothetical protein [Candidatus Moranbacteria bacterium]
MEISQIQNIPEVIDIMKILTTGFLAFVLAFLLTPLLTALLYKYKIGIKIKECSVDGKKLTYINQLHKDKCGTPTMGGILVWFSVFILILASQYVFPYLAVLFHRNFFARLDFWSRSQTWLPLFVLVTAGILGLFDDWMSIKGIGTNKGGGMRFLARFGWLIAIAAVGAWWFYGKLGW